MHGSKLSTASESPRPHSPTLPLAQAVGNIPNRFVVFTACGMLSYQLYMRFDAMIRAGMIVREVKVKYPGTTAVFEEYGFRDACDDCSIEVVARKYGLRPEEIVDKLNQAAFGR